MLCLIAAVPPLMLAQSSDRNKPQSGRATSIRPFGGRGGERQSLREKPPPPPPPLTNISLQAAMKSLGKEAGPGTLYVKLTPSQPTVPNRGALVFAGADVVEGGEDYATWSPRLGSQPQGFLVVWLKSAANQRYIIDCAVHGASVKTVKGDLAPGDTAFEVLGPDGTTQTTKFTGTEGQHLLFPLNAANAGWYSFRITGSGSGIFFLWAFYSCEVTNL